ncbi:MAG: hypothetical protein CM15mP44_7150 [Candidatus Neomarinimicrobiota bacterium]|nr:MAG: hypothetical protein CM15mP44_7150 [Candidatus Neomarinimicrobiota bacterium]
MDLSIIDELPSNRIPVTKKIVDNSKIKKVYGFIKDQIALGRQANSISLVKESKKLFCCSLEAPESLSSRQFKKNLK